MVSICVQHAADKNIHLYHCANALLILRSKLQRHARVPLLYMYLDDYRIWARIIFETADSSAEPATLAPGNTLQKRSVSSPAKCPKHLRNTILKRHARRTEPAKAAVSAGLGG